jgi:MFS transporter, ACDE family, multidrug resistance protein
MSSSTLSPAAHAAPRTRTTQPKAVWAVAFASVIAFMGIGLVDTSLVLCRL